ncbi:hypothetical protein BMS3Bbin04_01888 [bacterium BMS3Bbin04]|nr:hypothetical protein BMS3Bbin04_01888 [bacterium BMS3Bbin04]
MSVSGFIGPSHEMSRTTSSCDAGFSKDRIGITAGSIHSDITPIAGFFRSVQSVLRSAFYSLIWWINAIAGTAYTLAPVNWRMSANSVCVAFQAEGCVIRQYISVILEIVSRTRFWWLVNCGLIVNDLTATCYTIIPTARSTTQCGKVIHLFAWPISPQHGAYRTRV